jgi:large subunit ribosomal protein L23
MINPESVLKESRITEKASALTANFNQYTFEVYPNASKYAIAAAVEKAFGVKVARVNVIRKKPRKVTNRMARNLPGRKAGMKKAVVTLKEGETISLV